MGDTGGSQPIMQERLLALAREEFAVRSADLQPNSSGVCVRLCVRLCIVWCVSFAASATGACQACALHCTALLLHAYTKPAGVVLVLTVLPRSPLVCKHKTPHPTTGYGDRYSHSRMQQSQPRSPPTSAMHHLGSSQNTPMHSQAEEIELSHHANSTVSV